VSRRDRDEGRLQPFVPLLKETLDCPAWRAISHGARSLYIALKRRYNRDFNNNGRLYLSQRDAAEEIGSDQKQVARWFRELQHYGFVVMTSAGYLGVDGQGRAPSWRLTEIGYMKDAPTRDFMRWVDGNFFVNEKQNPDGEIALRVRGKTPSPATVNPPSPNGTSEGEITSIEADEVRGNPPSNLVYHSVEPKGSARRQPHQLSRAELEASYARRRVQ
jgi:hypothetical protein